MCFGPSGAFCVLESASGAELVLDGATSALMDDLAAMGRDCGVAVAPGDGLELDPSLRNARRRDAMPVSVAQCPSA